MGFRIAADFDVEETVVLAPDEPSLLGLVSLVAPVIVGGNSAIVVASEKFPLPAATFATAADTAGANVSPQKMQYRSFGSGYAPHLWHRRTDAVIRTPQCMQN